MGELMTHTAGLTYGAFGSTAGQGSYLWDGIAGTWFWIDPSNDLTLSE
jgi:CubicO group peptidase (beta-lactamase class C family)